jgi:hypothetical protein
MNALERDNMPGKIGAKRERKGGISDLVSACTDWNTAYERGGGANTSTAMRHPRDSITSSIGQLEFAERFG